MKDRNTMGIGEYILYNVLYLFMFMVYYKIALFVPVGELTGNKAMICMGAMVLAVDVVCILATVKRRRNLLSVIVNTIWAYGVYFLATFARYIPKATIITCVVAAVLSAAYFGWVLWVYYRQEKLMRIVVPLKRCIDAALLTCRTVAALVFAVLLIGCSVRPLLGMPILEGRYSEPVEKPSTSTQGVTVEDHIDKILLLRQSQWEKCDVQTKLDVLKAVADIEAAELGIPAMEVGAGILEGRTMGQFNHGDRTITMSIEYLHSAQASQMLHTICHEVYHAYQERMVAAYESVDEELRGLSLFRDAVQYRYEFTHYIDGNEDYEGYDDQQCERDSDTYAQKAAVKYYKAIVANGIVSSDGT